MMLNNRSRYEEQLKSASADEPIVIVCAADDKYAMPLAVMARSVLENLKSDQNIIFFVIDGGIKNNNKKKILKTLSDTNCEISFLPSLSSYFDESFKDAFTYIITKGQAKHLPIETYSKLLIPKILPQKFDKAIYLDCDLVVNKDLNQLWQIDLDENYVLAVPDIWIQSLSAHNGLLNYQDLGIKDINAKYFNAGVLVINLKKWRTENILEKATEYIKQNKKYIRFHEQDILNALLVSKWGELNPRWNVTPGILEYSSWEESPFEENTYNNLVDDSYIIHFAAEAKPWNAVNAPFKEHFFRYIDLTAWSGWRFTFWNQLKLKIAYKLKKLRSIIANYKKFL